jgi:hypothetical protein
MALRMGAGGVVGGATGLATSGGDLSHGAMGAAIGGAAPPVFKGIGAAGEWSGKKLFDLMTPDMQKRAVQLAQTTGKSIDEIISALSQQGPVQIPGSQKTVPQILQDPNISQVARTLKSSGKYDLGQREALNNEANMQALERIAPTYDTINEARSNVGNATSAFAKASEKSASGRVSQLFDAIPKDEAKIKLPFGDMQAAIDKYLGRGSFGEGEGAVNTAMSKAKQIGMEAVPAQPNPLDAINAIRARNGQPVIASATTGPAMAAKPVPFDELQHLRSSISEAANKAKLSGDLQASAALKSMKASIDNKMGAAVGGMGEAGETFTPAAADAYGQALTAHAAKKERFAKGPQAAIFRIGSDGLPAKEGAEVAPLFWNSGNAQSENMQAFKRLIAGDEGLTNEMKRNAITEAAQVAAKGAKGGNTPEGTMTANAFGKWLDSHSGAAKELFNPSELATLKAIKNETGNAAAANALGRAEGSPTAQNLFSMGALDNPKLQALANNAPLKIKYITGPMLSALKSSVSSTRNETLSKLLADPELMAESLKQYGMREAGRTPNKLTQLLQSPEVQQQLYRLAPQAANAR